MTASFPRSKRTNPPAASFAATLSRSSSTMIVSSFANVMVVSSAIGRAYPSSRRGARADPSDVRSHDLVDQGGRRWLVGRKPHRSLAARVVLLELCQRSALRVVRAHRIQAQVRGRGTEVHDRPAI